jgi:hypothetical protein
MSTYVGEHCWKYVSYIMARRKFTAFLKHAALYQFYFIFHKMAFI